MARFISLLATYILYASKAVPSAVLVRAFSPGSGDGPFSLSNYQRARARETSDQLDASRFHFQILFVDDDNFHGRIAEGVLAKVAEYNDALFTLFPYSATITEASSSAPLDPAAPEEAVAVCETLDLCSVTCSEDGTSFNLSYLDQYDLIIALNDDIQSMILRSLPSDSGYEHKCRLLSEFLSMHFCGIQSKDEITSESLQNMMEATMWDRAKPFYDLVKDSSSDIFLDSKTTWDDVYQPRMMLSENGAAVPNQTGWPLVESAMLVACAGITRFCLDTMDVQFDTAFQRLLDAHFHRKEHLDFTIEQADDQLRLGSLSITGYFSPKERHARIKSHFDELGLQFD